jgi:hypothetical protein
VAQAEGERLSLAWVQGVVDRHVRYPELTVEERAEAVAEVRAVTTRPELLAEVAGIRRGMGPFKVPPQEAARYERQAALLIDGFDLDLAEIAKWSEVGRRRAEERHAERLR